MWWERLFTNLIACLIISLTLFQTSPSFHVSAEQVFWNTVTSNFSFSHSVFYPSGELSAISIKLEIVICIHFDTVELEV